MAVLITVVRKGSDWQLRKQRTPHSSGTGSFDSQASPTKPGAQTHLALTHSPRPAAAKHPIGHSRRSHAFPAYPIVQWHLSPRHLPCPEQSLSIPALHLGMWQAPPFQAPSHVHAPVVSSQVPCTTRQIVFGACLELTVFASSWIGSQVSVEISHLPCPLQFTYARSAQAGPTKCSALAGAPHNVRRHCTRPFRSLGRLFESTPCPSIPDCRSKRMRRPECCSPRALSIPQHQGRAGTRARMLCRRTRVCSCTRPARRRTLPRFHSSVHKQARCRRARTFCHSTAKCTDIYPAPHKLPEQALRSRPRSPAPSSRPPPAAGQRRRRGARTAPRARRPRARQRPYRQPPSLGAVTLWSPDTPSPNPSLDRTQP